MKCALRLLAVTAIFLVFSSQIIGQNWLPNGTTWYFEATDWGRPAGIFTYEITGDTIILGKDCKVLTVNSAGSCNYRPQKEFLYKEYDKLFLYNFQMEKFGLLYDFSAKVGDTIKVPLWENIAFPQYYIVVNKIQRIRIGPLSIKKFLVTYSFDFEWGSREGEILEDLGSLTNFYHFVEDGFCDRYHVSGLRCLSHPQYGNYSFLNEGCDGIIVGTREETEREIIEIATYPNPTSDQLNVTGIPAGKEIFWSIYGLDGMKVSGGEIETESPKDFIINTEGLMQSVYFIVLRNARGEKLYSSRFVKN